jgi:hypothetical protein
MNAKGGLLGETGGREEERVVEDEFNPHTLHTHVKCQNEICKVVKQGGRRMGIKERKREGKYN